MNHTATINIWKKANRVSRLGEELAEDCVAPDPRTGAGLALAVRMDPDLPLAHDLELLPCGEAGLASFPASGWEASEAGDEPFMEHLGRESIHRLKQAIDVLTAPPEEASVTGPGQEHLSGGLRAAAAHEQKTGTGSLLTEADRDWYPATVRVAYEPEPHASSIETRRMAYGLKIPRRPLHKRPFYLRLFFCLHTWWRRMSGKDSIS